MRHPLIASTMILAAAMTVTLAPELGRAQSQSEQLPLPPGGFKPPPMAPIKAYKAVAVTPPAVFSDAAFVAFRKQLADVAQHRDRAALAKLVVAQGFFWVQDKDLADKRKSGIDNLAKAIDLDAKDGSGWEMITGYASEQTAAPLPDRQGVICAPANPDIDPKAFDALLDETQSDPLDWGYPTKNSVDVHSAPKPSAPVVEKLAMTLVRVVPERTPPSDPVEQMFLRIATPSGKAGFVLGEEFSGLGGDQICYTKDAGGWKIIGYFGGAGE